jgi:hypothetical protein
MKFSGYCLRIIHLNLAIMEAIFFVFAAFVTLDVTQADPMVLESFGQSFGQGFLQRVPEILGNRTSGQLSNPSAQLGLQTDLTFFSRRQETCDTAGYGKKQPPQGIPSASTDKRILVICASYDHCCPPGDVCTANSCCSAGQEQCGDGCYDPDTSVCCASYSTYCELGQVCVTGGNCCPSGQVPCGTHNCYDPTDSICCTSSSQAWGCPLGNECCSDGYCYDSTTEICCQNGNCQDDTTCCTYQCCTDIAYCGDDGYCSACPLIATETATASSESIVVVTSTVTITQASESEEAEDFTCFPLTVTNSVNATLELDTDCTLSYIPPSTTSPAVKARTAGLHVEKEGGGEGGGAVLRPRQTYSCIPITTEVTTTTLVNTITSSTTLSITVFEAPEDDGFSCPTMAVTNQAGDVLSLDESCSLEYSAAPPTTSSTTSNSPTPAGSVNTVPAQTTKSSAAGPAYRVVASMWEVIMVMVVIRFFV